MPAFLLTPPLTPKVITDNDLWALNQRTDVDAAFAPVKGCARFQAKGSELT